jgi:catechol 2,3-dioxygenase-like lactoylglutathione lyase family enzyme
MMSGWYVRPVVNVRDTPAALAFYSGKLGFKEDWRYAEDGRLMIVQVSRHEFEIILSDQWPEEAGRAKFFIELNKDQLAAFKADAAERGLALGEGWWGYKLLTFEDLDGNRFWFPHDDQNDPEGVPAPEA